MLAEVGGALFGVAIENVNAIAALLSAVLIWSQIRSAVRWNRLQTTHATLREIVVGRFSEILHSLAAKHNWDIVREQKTYEEARQQALRSDQAGALAVDLDSDLQSLLRILETICISVDRGIVEESICREYLFSIVKSVYRNSADFILQERRKRNEPQVFALFEKYAVRWGAKVVRAR